MYEFRSVYYEEIVYDNWKSIKKKKKNRKSFFLRVLLKFLMRFFMNTTKVNVCHKYSSNKYIYQWDVKLERSNNISNVTLCSLKTWTNYNVTDSCTISLSSFAYQKTMYGSQLVIIDPTQCRISAIHHCIGFDDARVCFVIMS